MAHFTDTERTKRKLNRGVAWERFAHPHTDPQAQICHLQYVIYRACIRLLPSFSDFLSPHSPCLSLVFRSLARTDFLSGDPDHSSLLNMSRLTLASGLQRGQEGCWVFFYTQPPSLNFCIFTLQN